MPDDPKRKPDPPDDDGLYELAEDPDLDAPASSTPLAPGIMPTDDAPAELDPMADDRPAAPAGEGGSGGRSHFSGDDPEYVNPEIARMRREEQRMARAAEEAAEAARKQKFMLIGGGILVLLLIVAYFVLL